MANRAAGKGYESEDYYDNVKFQFVGIENIHVMRQSLYKMLEGKRSYLSNKKKTDKIASLLSGLLSLSINMAV